MSPALKKSMKSTEPQVALTFALDGSQGPNNDISELLRIHSHEIDQLKKGCKEELDAPSVNVPYDDIFLLRFVLSSSDHLDAMKSLKEAIVYRHENRAWLSRVLEGRAGPTDELVDVDEELGFRGITLADTTDQGHSIAVIFLKDINMGEVVKTLSTEELTQVFNYNKEIIFLLCDRETRKTGRLSKVINVVDAKDIKLSELKMGFLKTLGAASKIVERSYPQLLDMTVITNTPRWFRRSYSLIAAFFPARTVAKLKVIKIEDVADVVECELDKLPTFLGGKQAQPNLWSFSRDSFAREAPVHETDEYTSPSDESTSG